MSPRRAPRKVAYAPRRRHPGLPAERAARAARTRLLRRGADQPRRRPPHGNQPLYGSISAASRPFGSLHVASSLGLPSTRAVETELPRNFDFRTGRLAPVPVRRAPAPAESLWPGLGPPGVPRGRLLFARAPGHDGAGEKGVRRERPGARVADVRDGRPRAQAPGLGAPRAAEDQARGNRAPPERVAADLPGDAYRHGPARTGRSFQKRLAVPRVEERPPVRGAIDSTRVGDAPNSQARTRPSI